MGFAWCSRVSSLIRYSKEQLWVLSFIFYLLNEQGSGFLEAIYENSLFIALQQKRLRDQIDMRLNFGNPKLEYKRLTRHKNPAHPVYPCNHFNPMLS